MASFEQDSQIKRLDSNTFTATLTKPFCVGNVPNGGYVASIFLKVASAYLGPRKQPDSIATHWLFLNATQVGPAVLVVEDAKKGRGTSVVHITLYQGELLDKAPWVSAKTKKRTVAYMTNTSLEGEKGVTMSTGFTIKNPPPPVDLEKLGGGNDESWERLHMPILDYVPSLKIFEYYIPKAGPRRPATYDFWLRFANGERFTNASLGYISDQGPPLIVESFRPLSPDEKVPEGGFAYDKIFWYPTLTMSLEIKKSLKQEGEEWLRLRVEAKVLKNGRYDSEVVIFDAKDEIVALSNHVALALDIERNISRKQKL